MTEEELIELLSAAEHDRWAHWQRYVHSQAIVQGDGALTIPAELVERWERQIKTAFDDLSPAEQKSDRDQVRKVLPIIQRYLADGVR